MRRLMGLSFLLSLPLLAGEVEDEISQLYDYMKTNKQAWAAIQVKPTSLDKAVAAPEDWPTVKLDYVRLRLPPTTKIEASEKDGAVTLKSDEWLISIMGWEEKKEKGPTFSQFQEVLTAMPDDVTEAEGDKKLQLMTNLVAKGLTPHDKSWLIDAEEHQIVIQRLFFTYSIEVFSKKSDAYTRLMFRPVKLNDDMALALASGIALLDTKPSLEALRKDLEAM